jgi:DNA-directed RNA polymerase specialized sigma24 family protein
MMDVSILEQGGVVDSAGSAAAVSRALAALSEIDLLRLRALARLRARGLPPGIDWSDLLNEALARALDGSRQWPPGVPFLVFLAGVMRSVCDEVWRRRRREAALLAFGAEADARDVACQAADQERVLAACEAVAAIHRLFAGDRVALLIVAGLANGQSAEDIRVLHGMTPAEYNSARRRMRRALLRAELPPASAIRKRAP